MKRHLGLLPVILILAVAFTVFASVIINAGAEKGFTVSGKITSDKAVKIGLYREGEEKAAYTLTNAKGEYELTTTDEGSYIIKAEADGYYTFEEDITVEKNLDFDINLHKIGDKQIVGDLNGDGRIKGNDATLFLKYLADWDVSIRDDNADLDGDGKIKGRDVTMLLKYLAGWDVSFGMEIIENEKVAYTFEKNGFLSVMSLKCDEREIFLYDDYASGVTIKLGDEKGTYNASAGIYRYTGVRPTITEFSYNDGIGVEFAYDDIPDKNGEATGIALNVRYFLDDGAELLRAKTYIENRGDRYLAELRLGFEGVELPVPEKYQTMTVPTSSLGQFVENPLDYYCGTECVYTVPTTVPNGLACSWFDYSGDGIGVAVGYLNSSGIDMLGDIGSYESGVMSMDFRFFRYAGGFRFMEEEIGKEQIYSLCPGESYASDDWFFGVHSDDWHTTAKFYRDRYEEAFDGDFTDWEALSPKAKNADVIFTDSAAWADKLNENGVYTDYDMNGTVRHTFAEIADRLETAINNTHVAPENTLFVLMGTGTHWGIYKLPDYFPACTEAGGDEGLAEMDRYIKEELGVSGIHYYAHTSFNHRESDNYVASADTGYCPLLYADYTHLGTIACIADENWQNLWKNTIIPSFVERNADGIEFDEGFGHHYICQNGNHTHGSVAERLLTAQINGMLDIFRECRKQFKKESYFETEGASDVAARLMDLWEAGGIDQAEIVRYTHPDRLTTVFANSPNEIHDAFIYGCPVLTSVDAMLTDTGYYDIKDFAEIRAQIRGEEAYGYPNCFKDEYGLKVSGNIKAKLYADGEGITVAYYSETAQNGSFTVDLSLYSERKEKIEIDICTSASETGYVKIPFDSSKTIVTKSVAR